MLLKNVTCRLKLLKNYLSFMQFKGHNQNCKNFRMLTKLKKKET